MAKIPFDQFLIDNASKLSFNLQQAAEGESFDDFYDSCENVLFLREIFKVSNPDDANLLKLAEARIVRLFLGIDLYLKYSQTYDLVDEFIDFLCGRQKSIDAAREMIDTIYTESQYQSSHVKQQINLIVASLLDVPDLWGKVNNVIERISFLVGLIATDKRGSFLDAHEAQMKFLRESVDVFKKTISIGQFNII